MTDSRSEEVKRFESHHNRKEKKLTLGNLIICLQEICLILQVLRSIHADRDVTEFDFPLFLTLQGNCIIWLHE